MHNIETCRNACVLGENLSLKVLGKLLHVSVCCIIAHLLK